MRFTTLEQWLDWQSGLHPSEIEMGLARVSAVWRRLCPEGLSSRVVTVAGTNGKGSCVAMLDAIYRQAGYRVATYTSPHLIRYNERIRLNGVSIDDHRLCQAFDAVDKARDKTTLTYFEFGTLAALYLFAQSPPDVVILEVGLGGRLDAVNIIDTDLALITTIDIDHQNWLGETREAIGREKAGIMRSGRPAVLADPAMPESVFAEARRLGAEVMAAGRDYHWRENTEGWHWSGPDGVALNLPKPALRGAWQLQNAAAVVMVIQALNPQLPVDESGLSAGLAGIRLPGRQQMVPGHPPVLLDVAHNCQAVKGLASSLEQIAPQTRIRAVFGLLRDKDATAIASLLSARIEAWYLMDLPGERGQTSEKLADALQLGGVGSPIHTYRNFRDAFQGALGSAREDELILVFGSFIVVGEALHYLGIE
ncbi:MAG: bifunctional tetrahydrofolate synthase/dihydrofolate synthase [Candidatus Thiodiazotropha sp.]